MNIPFKKILIVFLLLPFITPRVHATEAYLHLTDQVYILKELEQDLNQGTAITRDLLTHQKYNFFEMIRNNILNTFSIISEDEQTPPIESGNTRWLDIVTHQGHFYLIESGFLDAYSLSFISDQKYNIINSITSDILSMRQREGKKLNEKIDFANLDEAESITKKFFKTLGIDPRSYTFKINGISEKSFKEYQRFYNENAEDFDPLDLQYEDLYVVTITRQVKGLDFLNNGQMIGNPDSGTHVTGEGHKVLISRKGVVYSELFNLYPINEESPIGNVEDNKSILLNLLKEKFDNLIVTDPIYIDEIRTLYAPYPVGDIRADKRTMEFQPLWQVNVKIKNGEYDEKNPHSSQYFDMSFYFSIKEHKEILQ